MGTLWLGPGRAAVFLTAKEYAVRRPIEVATMLGALLGAAAGNAYGQTAAERFVLSGVVVFDGGGGVAWLHEPTLTQSRVIALRPGESIGSYRLEKILDDRVELKGPGGTVLVPLYSGAPAAVASAAGSGSPGPGPAPAPNGPAAPSRAGAEPAVDPGRAERQVERRARLDQALEKRAAAQKGSEEGPQPAAASPNNTPDKISASNPYKDNPNVLFLPRGDARRSPNFPSLRGAK